MDSQSERDDVGARGALGGLSSVAAGMHAHTAIASTKFRGQVIGAPNGDRARSIYRSIRDEASFSGVEAEVAIHRVEEPLSSPSACQTKLGARIRFGLASASVTLRCRCPAVVGPFLVGLATSVGAFVVDAAHHVVPFRGGANSVIL